MSAVACNYRSVPRPRVITTIRVIAGQWVVIRNGRQVFQDRVRTACEQWVVHNPT